MRLRKVAGDLKQYALQTGLVALVLLLGTAGVVAALNARAVLKREIDASYAQAKSPDLALWFERVTPELLAAVAAKEDVAAVDARRVVFTRIEAGNGTWLPLRLTILRDFSIQQLGTMHRHGGFWPPQDGGILIEQSGQSLLGHGVGAPLRIRRPDGTIVSLPLAGFVHDPAVAPSTQERTFYAFVTAATADLLGQSPHADQLLVKMAYRDGYSDAAGFGSALNAALKRTAQPAFRVDVLPLHHPHAGLMNAMLQVLGVLSAIALICSAALAGYLVAAWMRREVRQVGIMKTLGARWWRIAGQYLALVLPLLLPAIALGLMAGVALGGVIIDHYAVVLNVDLASTVPPPELLWREAAWALAVPLLAMALPILRAARMPALRAIHDAGITAPSVGGRLAARMLRLPGSITLSFALRNAWRRPWRLLAMVLALASGGTLLLTTQSNYESLIRVIDISLGNQGHDIEVLLQRGLPAAQLETIARRVPEVAIAEAWRRAGVSIVPQDAVSPAPLASETSRFTLGGFPADSRLFKLPVVQGRMPRVDAADEVLVTRRLQQPFPRLQVGSTVELQFRERRAPVRVVGVVEEIAMSTMYANPATFDAVTALGDSAFALRVKTASAEVDQVAKALDQAFMSAGIAPAQIISRGTVRDALDEHFKVVGDVIRMVALAAALIGAIVLAATTGFNVLERRREIGVIRTLGATPRRITGLFLAEAASVTLVSAGLAIAASLLLTRLMLDAAESRLLHVTVPMQFSLPGLALLCAGALVVMAAVWLVTRFALRQTVREALAYE